MAHFAEFGVMTVLLDEGSIKGRPSLTLVAGHASAGVRPVVVKLLEDFAGAAPDYA
jgi:hypothetical protein